LNSAAGLIGLGERLGRDPRQRRHVDLADDLHRISALAPLHRQVIPLPAPGLTFAPNENKSETTLDWAPLWRHPGAMLADSKTASVRTLDRINLRLPAETFEAIDASRIRRPGNISRNTWITEAIHEKLARDRAGV
jgi:hypothetical protein